MFTVITGAFYDGFPLISLAVAFVWTLRYQKIADLSLAGSFSVSAAYTAYLLNAGHSPLLSIAIGLLVGVLVGIVMGLSVNALKIEPLIAGLIVLFITYALSLGITQGTIPIPDNDNPLSCIRNLEVRTGATAGLYLWINGFFLAISAVFVLGTSKLLNSEWGCAFRALEDLKGGKPLLRSLGIMPAKLSIIGFGIAGFLSSISGILVALRDRQTTSSLGLDSLVDVIPAYLLGVVLFEKRPEIRRSSDTRIIPLIHLSRSFSTASAATIGVVIFFLTVNWVQQIAPLPWLPKVLIGITLLILLGLQPGIENWNRRRKELGATVLTKPTSSFLISKLSVTYPTWNGNKTVLQNFSMEAFPGEIIQIKGSNGSGKSTLFKALIGEVRSSGKFRIPAVSNAGHNLSRSATVAYIPQDADESTATTLSIAEHAVLSLCGSNPSPFRNWTNKADPAFKQLNVQDVVSDQNAFMKWLSGGQKRRVALGLIALRTPKPVVVALDEPFDDLDVEGRIACASILKTLAEQEHIVLFIDHQDHIKPTKTIEITNQSDSL